MSNVSSEPSDLLPMIVYYQERLSAAGKTSRGYFKREGRIKDREVWHCGQPCLWTSTMKLKYDIRFGAMMVCTPQILWLLQQLELQYCAPNRALSEVPNTNTVAGVRVGLTGDKFVVNPTTMEMKESKLDLLLAGSENGILMIEAMLVDDNCSGKSHVGNGLYWPSTATLPPPQPHMEVPRRTSTRPHQSSDRLSKQTSSDKLFRLAKFKCILGFNTDKNMKFLLQKVLKQSDVGSLGRIVMPKKEAESHLLDLNSRDGITIPMEDIGTSQVWNMRYRLKS
ncbi:putative polyribonucleotide nucleotidyltransferase [Helianthus annuus]|nr:putative polyribonucleotide nucleotidyltransferase [Helianthus annuus]